MRDEVVYNKIKDAIEAIDEIDSLITTQPDELQKVDYEISDWLHYIENNETTGKQNEIIVKKLRALRLQRKSLHKEHAIERAYKENSSKMMGNNTRQLLLTEIHKTIKQWENEYKNRILSEDDIKNILSTVKKVGRPKKTVIDLEGVDNESN